MGDKLAPLIAIVGSDGAGKSTLAADVVAWLAPRRPAAACYLGLRSGDLGNRIRRLPLVGTPLERLLARKAGETRTIGGTVPGLATALVVYGYSLLRRRRFRRMLALRRRGVVAVTDRYPQTEVPGFFDGPGLSAARPGSTAVARLARRERRMYEWMASFRPDVVIRLGVDADTAFARKPDHKPELLRAKVAAVPLLLFNGAPIVDVDASAPYAEVRAHVLAVVAKTMAD